MAFPRLLAPLLLLGAPLPLVAAEPAPALFFTPTVDSPAPGAPTRWTLENRGAGPAALDALRLRPVGAYRIVEPVAAPRLAPGQEVVVVLERVGAAAPPPTALELVGPGGVATVPIAPAGSLPFGVLAEWDPRGAYTPPALPALRKLLDACGVPAAGPPSPLSPFGTPLGVGDCEAG